MKRLSMTGKAGVIMACLTWLYCLACLAPMVCRGDDCGSATTNGGGTEVVEVPRSIDPNEMAGPLGFDGERRCVIPGQWLDYTVYFENLATAAAAAQEVRVDAVLSEYLDWSSFELGELVIGSQSISSLAGNARGETMVSLKGRSDQVKIVFSLDNATGAIQWYLRSYDKTRSRNGYWPANDYDGFLPPNDDTGRGEGHLCYRVRVRSREELELLAEESIVIHAAAEIVFDDNAMILTDPAWHNTVYRGLPLPTIETITPDGAELPYGTRMLTWTAAGGAETYEVTFWLYENGTVAETWTVEDLLTPSVSLPMQLIPYGDYRWQITARNGNGSTNSDIWHFTMLPEGEVMTISLRQGWNLFALPGTWKESTNPDMLEELTLMKFDPGHRAYHRASLPLPAGTALWGFSRMAKDYTFVTESVPLPGALPELRIGWNLVGISGNEPQRLSTEGVSVWERVNDQWRMALRDEQGFILEPQQGYFIHQSRLNKDVE